MSIELEFLLKLFILKEMHQLVFSGLHSSDTEQQQTVLIYALDTLNSYGFLREDFDLNDVMMRC